MAALELDGVGVEYRLRRRNRHAHVHRHPGNADRLWGLRNLTLAVERGEFVGLVGRNGAGKTTLLLTAAGVLRPDEGTVKLVGRAAPVLGVGTGLVAGLSGWDNIELLSVLLGVPRAQARARRADIAEFAGLHDFLDAPVRTYSNGMRARLGFAVVAFCGADVLLLDEVAAVGDQEFRLRSTERLKELQATGATILLATHDLEGLEKSAGRVAWLQNGELHEVGAPSAVISRYRSAPPPPARS